jgi:hypothetical protein
MAQRKLAKTANAAVDERQVVESAALQLVRDGVLKLSSVKPPALRATVVAELERQGFEATKSVVRTPLMAQLAQALAHGALIPLEALSSHVRGASKAELKALVTRAVKEDRAHRVLRGRAEALAGPEVSIVADARLSSLRGRVAALSKALEKADKSAGLALLASDVDEALSDALSELRRRLRTPPKHNDEPMTAVLAAVDATRDAKTGLSFVPAVVETLAEQLDAALVGKLLLSAARKDLLELRPEGGIARLSEAELSVCPPGPQGTRLSWARRLGGGQA